MGTCVSSYGNTMGFSASTEVAKETTRSYNTFLPYLFNKINQFIKFVSHDLCYFCMTKSNQKTSDCDLCYFCADKSNQKPLGEADLSKNQTTRMFVKTRQRLTRLFRQLTNKEGFMRCLIFVALKSANAQTQDVVLSRNSKPGDDIGFERRVLCLII